VRIGFQVYIKRRVDGFEKAMQVFFLYTQGIPLQKRGGERKKKFDDDTIIDRAKKQL